MAWATRHVGESGRDLPNRKSSQPASRTAPIVSASVKSIPPIRADLKDSQPCHALRSSSGTQTQAQLARPEIRTNRPDLVDRYRYRFARERRRPSVPVSVALTQVEIVARVVRAAAAPGLRDAAAEHVSRCDHRRSRPEEACVDAGRGAGSDSQPHQEQCERKKLARNEERPRLAVMNGPWGTPA